MKTLSYLITKCDWNGVHQRLQAEPEEASIPIPTGFDGKVYVLHQAICSKVSVPKNVLILMIQLFPNALDLNAFVGACENLRLSRDSMEALFDCSSADIYQNVRQDAQHYASIAVKKKNTCAVQIFMERFPSILNGYILSDACMHGTAEMVDKIIVAGLHQNVGKSGGLFIRNDNDEDALDAAIRLYDEKDDERHQILITCIQHANAIRMGMKAIDPHYSVILAAAGLVPRRILGIFLKLYAHEITKLNRGGKHAIFKVIRMSMKENNDDNDLPPIFRSAILNEACNNGQLEMVQQLLEESTRKSFEHTSNVETNAIKVAADLFDENDNARCEILKSCVQHANAAKLGMKALPSSYPTILAAVGLIPPQDLLKIGKKFKHELRMLDRTGKFALKKVLRMANEEAQYAHQLDMRCQYPLSIPTTRKKFRAKLEPILSMRFINP